MVAAPCRAFVHAARWKGSAPHTTTGAARVSDSHCQLSNWRAGIIDSSTTGTDRTRETRKRCRSEASSRSPSPSPPLCPAPARVPASGRAGRAGAGGGGGWAV